ncbi:MAG: ABC transporter permease [Chitinophagales bacterium]|nr:MAG: ABC transporter permease [Chitinophagales bacterium]
MKALKMPFFYHFGRYLMMLGRCFARPERFVMYWKELLRQMTQIGVGSLGIISVMSLFIGAVTAVQFSYQLQDTFVPTWWIGFIVRNSMILELAPTFSSLLLAGKVGSHLASELGSMRNTEQIDALEIMGVNTYGYLVGPKILAAIIVFPLLIIFSVFFGIIGGLLAGISIGLYSVPEYVRGLQDELNPLDVQVMFLKTITFAFIITSISCYQGFYVSGGALEIGKASTRAVVFSSIVLIISNFIIAALIL